MTRAALLALAVAAASAQSNSTCSEGINLWSGAYATKFINGTAVNLSAYAGRVVLISNVASF